jgi:hypothetical protein
LPRERTPAIIRERSAFETVSICSSPVQDRQKELAIAYPPHDALIEAFGAFRFIAASDVPMLGGHRTYGAATAAVSYFLYVVLKEVYAGNLDNLAAPRRCNQPCAIRNETEARVIIAFDGKIDRKQRSIQLSSIRTPCVNDALN